MTTPSPDELRLLALAVARDAATFVAGAHSVEIVTAADSKSTSTDMVTLIDKASEERIVAALRAARPDDAILGEEGAGIAGTSGLRWVIDPIDGTTNFVYSYGSCAVSIGVVDEATEQTIAGAVVDVTRDEAFSAALGKGAFFNDAPITLRSGPIDIGHTLVSTGFSYSASVRAEQGEVLARILPIVRDIRRGGSAALDLCWVAMGRVDAYFERGTQVWDRVAGMLVAHEAGIQAETVGDLVWAAHPRIASELTALIL